VTALQEVFNRLISFPIDNTKFEKLEQFHFEIALAV
jgi:hypothetical protein